MSVSVDEERKEMAREYRLERGKRIMRQQQDVLRLWYEGLTVTLIAERLQLERHRVYFLLRVLELRDLKPPKRPPRPGHLYGLKVPPVEDSCEA